MRKSILTLILLLGAALAPLHAQQTRKTIDDALPIRGLAIEAPSVRGLDNFLKFIEEDLAPAHFNLLVLRIDWNYAYATHPELADQNPLSREDVGKIVLACRKHGIRLVPQINLLGHQSWAKNTLNLLRVYPEFDETPSVKTENYTGWPNPEGLYCKSYCPLHPDVHKVVFELVDEICDAFQTDAFHAGMDEVFYLGEKECPRCNGKDKAELYAGEVTLLRNHLAQKGRSLMIWGDRLLDGKTTGLGEWEASYNYTWRAIDMIPKDVLICDWHYNRAELTPVYFAMKGIGVVSCGWNNPATSVRQVQDMATFRGQSSREVSSNLKGYMHTIWSGADGFLRSYERVKAGQESGERGGDARALLAVMEEFKAEYNQLADNAK